MCEVNQKGQLQYAPKFVKFSLDITAKVYPTDIKVAITSPNIRPKNYYHWHAVVSPCPKQLISLFVSIIREADIYVHFGRGLNPVRETSLTSGWYDRHIYGKY